MKTQNPVTLGLLKKRKVASHDCEAASRWLKVIGSSQATEAGGYQLQATITVLRPDDRDMKGSAAGSNQKAPAGEQMRSCLSEKVNVSAQTAHT